MSRALLEGFLLYFRSLILKIGFKRLYNGKFLKKQTNLAVSRIFRKRFPSQYCNPGRFSLRDYSNIIKLIHNAAVH